MSILYGSSAHLKVSGAVLGENEVSGDGKLHVGVSE